MRFLGYGEDGLRHLKDLSDIVVVLFRPSFGRRGSGEVPLSGTADSLQFGEFDALLGTKRGVYLVEAKRSNSPLSNGRLSLRK
jgi:hypothetical protein